MSVEISGGFTCRDVELLPANEAELRAIYDQDIVTAMWEDFQTNFRRARGQAAQTTRAVSLELQNRGCEVHGGVSIKF